MPRKNGGAREGTATTLAQCHLRGKSGCRASCSLGSAEAGSGRSPRTYTRPSWSCRNSGCRCRDRPWMSNSPTRRYRPGSSFWPRLRSRIGPCLPVPPRPRARQPVRRDIRPRRRAWSCRLPGWPPCRRSIRHCIACLSSVVRPRIETKPAVPPMPHTAAVKVGFITHLSGKVSPNTPAPTAERAGENGLPRWTVCSTRRPDRQPIPCSLFVPKMSRTNQELLEPKKTAARCGAAVELVGIAPVDQCAVSTEELVSTAGSVVTDVSVGLAFSSSHSIGSGLR